MDVGAATKITGTEVPVGAHVYSVELWMSHVSGSASVGAVYKWFIAKARSGQTLGTDFPTPDFTAVGLSNLRSQIFHQELALVGPNDSNAYRWHSRIKIPKNMQRFRDGDVLFVKTLSDTGGPESVAFIYKYYR